MLRLALINLQFRLVYLLFLRLALELEEPVAVLEAGNQEEAAGLWLGCPESVFHLDKVFH